MGFRSWLSWLSLITGVFWAGAGTAAAQQSASPRREEVQIPFAELPEGLRERVRRVVEHPLLSSRGPAEAFAGRPTLYHWLLDHPVEGVRAWRRLGAECAEVTYRGGGFFGWNDGHGSEIHWQTAYDAPALRIWYAEGRVRPGLLLPPVPVHLVLLLYHGQRPDGDDHALLYHQAQVFLHTDSRTAALAARVFGPSGPRMAEQALAQLELFFSGLVWYLDQHPERTEPLLSSSNPQPGALTTRPRS